MDQDTLCKVWTVVHLFAVYTGANSLLLLQNSPALLPLVITTRDEAARGRVSLAVFWFFVATTSLIVSMSLGIAYQAQVRGPRDCVRYAPTMFSIVLIPKSKLAICYQAFWLGACTFVAGYGVAAGCRTIIEAPLYECEAGSLDHGSLIREGGAFWDGMWPATKGKDVRFDGCGAPAPANDAATSKLPHGVEYVPFLEDVFTVLLAVSAIVLVVVFWVRCLFQRPSSGAVRRTMA